MSGALYSVRDFFREGGDGDDVFRATVDSHTRDLNNYSMRFWSQQRRSKAFRQICGVGTASETMFNLHRT